MSINDKLPTPGSNPLFDLNIDDEDIDLTSQMDTDIGNLIGITSQDGGSGLSQIAELQKQADNFAKCDGNVRFALLEDNLNDKPVLFDPLALLKEKGAKFIAEQHAAHNLGIVHLENPKPGQKQKIHVPPELKERIEQYGFEEVGRNGVRVDHSPHDIEVKAWTPEQMAAINRIAFQAFTNLAKAHADHEKKMEEGENTLSNRTFTYLKDEKQLVPKDKFPDLVKLKAESEKKAQREEEQREDELAKENKYKKEQNLLIKENAIKLKEDRILRSEERKWDEKMDDQKHDKQI